MTFVKGKIEHAARRQHRPCVNCRERAARDLAARIVVEWPTTQRKRGPTTKPASACARPERNRCRISRTASSTEKKGEQPAGDAAQQQPNDEDEEAKRAKLPDFVSRLRGHLDVSGVNPPESPDGKLAPIDRMLLLRRAILLRSALERNAKEIFRKTRTGLQFANIHEDLIRAFLYASNDEHGSRSMEAIVQMSRFIDGHYVPTSLPMEELLRTHVDADSFIGKIAGWRSKRTAPNS
ncbi:hypothetical protein V4C56_34155 [Paraburkholderia azotifigens]